MFQVSITGRTYDRLRAVAHARKVEISALVDEIITPSLIAGDASGIPLATRALPISCTLAVALESAAVRLSTSCDAIAEQAILDALDGGP